MANIRPREREAIVQSLMAGVVPRIGLHHIQVGRREEIEALLEDLARIADGGAAVRFVIGRFGTGKSFFLNLVKTVALEKGFVVMQADVAPTRRLYASGGYAQALYTELARNMAIRTKPGGGALPVVIERWISAFLEEFEQGNKSGGDVFHGIREKLEPLQNLVSGYDFASVLGKYLEGYREGNDVLTRSCLRWLAGEYAVRTEARADLGVRSIIGDRDLYDYLKLWGTFARLAGYAGVLVELDEMGVLSHRLANATARNGNYEVLLQIVNDCLQGGVSGVGFIFAGTDAFFDDRRRGVMSYGALAGRLAANPWARDGLKDMAGPVIRLESLSPEDLWLLLQNIRNVFASGDASKYLLPDEGIRAFIRRCAATLGATFYQTPRDASKAFAGLLSILERNPGADWRKLLDDAPIEKEEMEKEEIEKEEMETPENGPKPTAADDELTGFVLK
ncbi:MAG: ATP-binding protein [Synergistaceae bacterium]|nr:ATP-binding protein [Synergistaceae bacterium]